jgi:hypothetical protein
MEIEFELDKNDLVEFNLFIAANSIEGQRQIRRVRLIYILSAVILTASGVTLLFVGDNIGNGLIISAVLIVFLMWYQLSKNQMRKRVTKGVDKTNDTLPNPNLCKQKLSISEEGIFYKSDFDEGKILWKSIREIKQSEKYIYLFELSWNKACVIPKRAFSNSESMALFIKFAEDYHNSSKDANIKSAFARK